MCCGLKTSLPVCNWLPAFCCLSPLMPLVVHHISCPSLTVSLLNIHKLPIQMNMSRFYLGRWMKLVLCCSHDDLFLHNSAPAGRYMDGGPGLFRKLSSQFTSLSVWLHVLPCLNMLPTINSNDIPCHSVASLSLSNLSAPLSILYSRALAAGRRCLHRRRFILRIPLLPLSSLSSLSLDGMVS